MRPLSVKSFSFFGKSFCQITGWGPNNKLAYSRLGLASPVEDFKSTTVSYHDRQPSPLECGREEGRLSDITEEQTISVESFVSDLTAVSE